MEWPWKSNRKTNILLKKGYLKPSIIGKMTCLLCHNNPNLNYQGTQVIIIPLIFLEISISDFKEFVLEERLKLFKGPTLKTLDNGCQVRARVEMQISNGLGCATVHLYPYNGRVLMQISTWKIES